MKLAQYLARSGLGSRRNMETLVKSGRVEVDGIVCTDQSREVSDARVTVDKKAIKPSEMVYFAWHKPKGVTTTFSDAHAAQTLGDALPEQIRRYPVFAVGRLDRDTEGLLILTTHGEWAESIIHPRNATEKVYRAQVAGSVPEATLAQLRHGVTLEDGPVTPKNIERVGFESGDEWLEVTLTEGRNRVVRRMVATADLELLRLVRTRIDTIMLGDLAVGEYRKINPRRP